MKKVSTTTDERQGNTVVQQMEGENSVPAAKEVKDSLSTSNQTATIEFDVVGGGIIRETVAPGSSAKFGREDLSGGVSKQNRQYVSGTHLEVRMSHDGALEVRDAESTNGTTLNGGDISDGEPRPLADGAELGLANGAVHMIAQIRR